MEHVDSDNSSTVSSDDDSQEKRPSIVQPDEVFFNRSDIKLIHKLQNQDKFKDLLEMRKSMDLPLNSLVDLNKLAAGTQSITIERKKTKMIRLKDEVGGEEETTELQRIKQEYETGLMQARIE